MNGGITLDIISEKPIIKKNFIKPSLETPNEHKLSFTVQEKKNP